MKFFDTLKKYANMVESENKRLKSIYVKLINEAVEAGVDRESCREGECNEDTTDSTVTANAENACDEADKTFDNVNEESAGSFFDEEEKTASECPECGKPTDQCICVSETDKNAADSSTSKKDNNSDDESSQLQSAEDFFNINKKAVAECDGEQITSESNAKDNVPEETSEHEETDRWVDADELEETDEWMSGPEFFDQTPPSSDSPDEKQSNAQLEEMERWVSAEDLLNGVFNEHEKTNTVANVDEAKDDDISIDDFMDIEDDLPPAEREAVRQRREQDQEREERRRSKSIESISEDDDKKLAESLDVYRRMNARLFQD